MSSSTPTPESESGPRRRIHLALLSIGAGTIILGLKFLAWKVSGSAALQSDAIEGVVNVLAAFFALASVIYANLPVDQDHPFGHGKIEYFSAAFEGGLISLAAVLIIYEGIQALLLQPPLPALGTGLLINVGAGLLNGLLGAILLWQGRRQRSKALEADGHHILSDFYTTLGLGLGLLMVKLTGLLWLDGALAILVGLLLAWTGFKLVKSSSDALLDRVDPDLLAKILDTINRIRPKDVIAVHDLKTLRHGRWIHLEIHVVIPEFFPVRQGHDLVESFGQQILIASDLEGESVVHLDPCGRHYCSRCDQSACPIREAPFERSLPLLMDEALSAGFN